MEVIANDPEGRMEKFTLALKILFEGFKKNITNSERS